MAREGEGKRKPPIGIGKPPGKAPAVEPAAAPAEGKPSGKKGGDALVLALATGLSVPQAAERAGIGVNTAYVRMRDPAVRREVARARDDLLSQAVGRLLSAACKAVDALEENLSDESAAVRNKAAQALLGSMIQGVTLVEISRRLGELESRASEQQQQAAGPARLPFRPTPGRHVG